MPDKSRRDILDIPSNSLAGRILRKQKRLNEQGILTLPKNSQARYLIGAWSALLGSVSISFCAGWYILYGVLAGANSYFVPGLILLLEGGVLLRFAVRAWRFRCRISKLTPASKAARHFGLEEAGIKLLAEDRGIQPRCILNGENLYDLADFGDADTLLRASTMPFAQPETLLRPVTASETPPETLLRASISQDSNP